MEDVFTLITFLLYPLRLGKICPVLAEIFQFSTNTMGWLVGWEAWPGHYSDNIATPWPHLAS
jgi:hypothetical protein